MDDEEYVNLEELIEEKQKLYQIQLNNDKLIIKNIGYGIAAPEVIIEENVGIDNNLSIYNCILSQAEIDSYSKENSYYPIIKLDEKKSEDIINTYLLSIKLNKEIELDKEIEEFEIFLILINGETGSVGYKGSAGFIGSYLFSHPLDSFGETNKPTLNTGNAKFVWYDGEGLGRNLYANFRKTFLLDKNQNLRDRIDRFHRVQQHVLRLQTGKCLVAT